MKSSLFFEILVTFLVVKCSQGDHAPPQVAENVDKTVQYQAFYITSEGYPSTNYLANSNYKWIVNRFDSTVCRITADFTYFQVEDSTNCANDKLTFTIKEVTGTTTGSTGLYCGTLTGTTKMFDFPTTLTSFEIAFTSNASIQKKGFQIKIIQHQNSCSKTIGVSPTSLRLFRAESKGFSTGVYGNNVYEIWNIRRAPACPRTTVVRLSVQYFNMQPYGSAYAGNICKDYFSYESRDKEVKRCGYYRPGTTWTVYWPLTSPIFRLKLVSDSTTDSGGVRVIVRQC